MNQPRIAFVGAGNMASSLIGGLLAQGHAPSHLSAADPGPERRQQIAAEFGIPVFADNNEAIQQADLIVLAVKPQVLRPVCQQLAPHLRPHQVLVSIAAGVSTQTLGELIGAQQPLIRCMPNTPALLGAGASGLFATAAVTNEQRALAERLLAAVGITLWLEEEYLLDAVTAVSGSGPAYFFLMMEAMAAAGKGLGLSEEAALRLTVQTALGAARMAGESGVAPAELRRRVTSPGGTTEAALRTLQSAGFERLVEQAIDAAAQRSAELAKPAQ